MLVTIVFLGYGTVMVVVAATVFATQVRRAIRAHWIAIPVAMAVVVEARTLATVRWIARLQAAAMVAATVARTPARAPETAVRRDAETAAAMAVRTPAPAPAMDA